MALNPYFNNVGETSEQDLQQDLVDEIIQIRGMNIMYLPRVMLSEDRLFGESAQCKYDRAVTIEVFVKEVAGWSGDGDILSKFALSIEDTTILDVSRRRFKEELVDKASPTGDISDTIQYPREGDLIYVPVFSSLFEIKHVEPDAPFRQFGERYIYELKVERYKQSHAFFDTGIPEIDRINELRKADNSGNDITKEVNADNIVAETEADGGLFDGFVDKTTVQRDANGKVINVSRGSGVVNFREGNGQTTVEDDIDAY